MVVIAVDEGVMPQTREHLAILSLLGIRKGVLVLTKGDLEWKKGDVYKRQLCMFRHSYMF